MYTAVPLGQTSILVSSEPMADQDRSNLPVSEESHQFFQADFDPELHAGTWLFRLKVCVDRREEAFEGFDCDDGQNFIYLDLQDCANFAEADKPTECTETEEEDEEENEYGDGEEE